MLKNITKTSFLICAIMIILLCSVSIIINLSHVASKDSTNKTVYTLYLITSFLLLICAVFVLSLIASKIIKL